MTDQEILRTLALKYREIAESPENAERRERAYKINALQAVRPIVWIHEIPWSEFDKCEELRPVCSDAFARGMETRLRRTIYQWKHFPADMIVENEFTVSKAYDVSPIGIRVQERRLATDERNYIVSHKYVDQLDTPEKVLALKCPVITPRPDTDAQNIEKAEALLGGILPVRLRGSFFGSAVWDDIATYRGMTNLLTDLACDEELMHLTAKRMYEIKTACAVQMSGHGLFSSFVSDLHCTPGYSHALENSGADGTSGGTWLRAMAQPFASVSPKMHDEFDIQYLIPLAERFAYVYYGCCEQLSDRLDVIKKNSEPSKGRRIPVVGCGSLGRAAWQKLRVFKKAESRVRSGRIRCGRCIQRDRKNRKGLCEIRLSLRFFPEGYFLRGRKARKPRALGRYRSQRSESILLISPAILLTETGKFK